MKSTWLILLRFLQGLGLLLVLAACESPFRDPPTTCEELQQPTVAALIALDVSYDGAREKISEQFGVDQSGIVAEQYGDQSRLLDGLEWTIGDTRYTAYFEGEQLVWVDAHPERSRTTVQAVVDCLGEPEEYDEAPPIEWSGKKLILLYPQQGQILRFSFDAQGDLTDQSPPLAGRPFIQSTHPGSLSSLLQAILGRPEAWDDYREPWPPR